MLHPRLEAANDVDDVEKLDGVLVKQQPLVRNSGVFPLLHRWSRLKADHLSKNVLRLIRMAFQQLHRKASTQPSIRHHTMLNINRSV